MSVSPRDRFPFASSPHLTCLLLTAVSVFWETLPHSHYHPESSQTSRMFRAIRFGAERFGFQSQWANTERYFASFGRAAASAVGADPDQVVAKTGVIDAILEYFGTSSDKIFGSKSFTDRIDDYVHNHMGWQLV